MSESYSIYGIEFTETQIRSMHERFLSDDPVMRIIAKLLEQTKEASIMTEDNIPIIYRNQGTATILKQLLTLPQSVKEVIGELE